jgi:integrase
MNRSSATDKSYLEQNSGKWRVTLSVPAHLRKSMGKTKIKQSLGTDSLAVANELKWGVLAKLKKQIADFERDGKAFSNAERLRVLNEAAEVAKVLAEEPAEKHHELAGEYLEERVMEILGAPVRYERLNAWEVDPDDRNTDAGTPIPVYDKAREQLASQFMNVAFHGGIPIGSLDEDYKKDRLKVSPRTEGDHDRALVMLAAFCIEQGIGDDIRKVDRWVVADFIAFLAGGKRLAARTSKKYVSRLKLYFDYAISLRTIEDNPWEKGKVHMPTAKNSDKERPFTETEAAKLLMGECSQALKDVMMIGALTGARLDAVVDLRADDIIELKCFRFKPQKREPGVRFIPIHPDLMETVKRRLEGKEGTDSLFPEYPIPANPRRERSFAASKQFTTYRRKLGVDEVVDGKRRARVNFHSWRRWFITKSERAGTPEATIAAIVGHTRKGMTLGHYSEGPVMVAARKAIRKVKLPPLDGSPIFEPEAVTPRS